MKLIKLISATAISALLVGGAQAADVFVEDVVAAPVAAPAPTWDGIFAGIHIGYGWTENDFDRLNPAPFAVDTDIDGVLGGIQIGYNYTVNNFLFGVIGDISLTGMDDTTFVTLGGGQQWDISTEYDYIATIRGRVGWIWNNNTLLYGHGGVAFADLNTNASGSAVFPGAQNFNLGGSETGWVAGAGIEAIVANRVSVFAEYSYMDFDASYSFNPIGALVFTSDNDPINAVKVGVNFKLW